MPAISTLGKQRRWVMTSRTAKVPQWCSFSKTTMNNYSRNTRLQSSLRAPYIYYFNLLLSQLRYKPLIPFFIMNIFIIILLVMPQLINCPFFLDSFWHFIIYRDTGE